MISATIEWQRRDQPFTDNRYSREHQWRFDGGQEILASASPDIVRPPLSNPAGVDPEEAFIAAISSCHMLWFLSIAARQGLVVDTYQDRATGELGNNSDGQTAITSVTLNPEVTWVGEQIPDANEIAALHHQAHQQCFIANSVRTDVHCQPVNVSS